MTQKVLLGDEAVALAAIHCGITAAYAYPGTPSTEILEYLQRHGPAAGIRAVRRLESQASAPGPVARYFA